MKIVSIFIIAIALNASCYAQTAKQVQERKTLDKKLDSLLNTHVLMLKRTNDTLEKSIMKMEKKSMKKK